MRTLDDGEVNVPAKRCFLQLSLRRGRQEVFPDPLVGNIAFGQAEDEVTVEVSWVAYSSNLRACGRAPNPAGKSSLQDRSSSPLRSSLSAM
jgi:hypothetical protein